MERKKEERKRDLPLGQQQEERRGLGQQEEERKVQINHLGHPSLYPLFIDITPLINLSYHLILNQIQILNV